MRAAQTYIHVLCGIGTSCSTDSNPRPLAVPSRHRMPEAYSIFPYSSLKFPIIQISENYAIDHSLAFPAIP